jgi:hypothetical protein
LVTARLAFRTAFFTLRLAFLADRLALRTAFLTDRSAFFSARPRSVTASFTTLFTCWAKLGAGGGGGGGGGGEAGSEEPGNSSIQPALCQLDSNSAIVRSHGHKNAARTRRRSRHFRIWPPKMHKVTRSASM